MLSMIGKILAGIILVLLVITAIGVIYVMQLDPAEQIEQVFAEKTGRTLDIKGDVTPGWSLTPTLKLHDVVISNPDWASTPDMAKIDSLDMQFDLTGLLSDRIEVTSIAIDGAVVHLEPRENGAGNWQMKVEPSAPQPARPAKRENSNSINWIVSSIDISDSDLYYHGSEGPATHLRIDEFEAALQEPANVAYKMEGSGRLDNRKLHLLAALKPWQDGEYSLDIMDITYGDVVAGGTLNIQPREPRPYVKLSLYVEMVDLDNLLAKKQNQESPEDPQAEAEAEPATVRGESIDARSLPAPAPGEGIFPDTPLPFDALMALDGDFSFAVEQIIYGKARFRDTGISASLREGLLKVKPSRTVFGEGNLAFSGEVEVNRPLPRIHLQLETQKIMIGRIMDEIAGSDDFSEGPLALSIDVEGRGQSVQDIVSTLDGQASFLIDKLTYKKRILDFASATQFFTLLRGGEEKKNTVITCAASHFKLDKGVAETSSLFIDTKAATVTGEGQVDLGRETISMVLTPRAKFVGLTDFVAPMRLEGRLTGPTFYPDPKGVITNVGKIAAGLSTGVGVLGALGINFAEKLKMRTGDSPCLAKAEVQAP